MEAERRPRPAARVLDALLWVAAAALLIWIVVVSLGPVPSAAPEFAWSDKAYHAAHYAVLAGLVLLAAVWRPGRGPGPWADHAPAVVLGLIGLGAALEVLQAFVGRQPDVVDLLADALGVAVAAGLWLVVRGRAGSTVRR
jgi:VanZ family protein